MKLNCSVSLGQRVLDDANSKQRHINSTLALCYNSKLKNFCIIWYTEQNQNGTKFEVNNISRVLTPFLHAGEATIEFPAPQHDLNIQADPILLKRFLHLLIEAVPNKMLKEDISFSGMCASFSKRVDKRMCITEMSHYPAKGFPCSLNVLHINNISLATVNKEILQLRNLTVLDLSHNSLESLPMELSMLPSLTTLFMSHNLLGRATPKMWSWLGSNFSKNWKVLHLPNNFLTYLPNSLVKLQDLTTLNVSFNQVQRLPKQIGVLKNLRVLSVSNNLITFLPASIRKLCLQTFDLFWNNWVATHPRNTSVIIELPILTLKEIALRRVLYLQLSFTSDDLPLPLIEELQNVEYCVCGTACLNTYIKQFGQLSVKKRCAQKMWVSPPLPLFIPIEEYFCSSQCINLTLSNRRKHIEELCMFI